MNVITSKESEKRERLILLGFGGILGGIGGGLAFGILLFIFGSDVNFFQNVANLISSTDNFIGILLHILIATVFGLIFGIFLILYPKFGNNIWITIGSGLLWGIILWIIGGHILFTLLSTGSFDVLLNMIFDPNFYVSSQSLLSLGSHILYGLLLAVITWYLPQLLD